MRLGRDREFHQGRPDQQVTQSAVSQTISTLERQFKSLLIERSKKNFRLTREGQVFYEYSKRILQSYDALHSQLQEIEEVISGNIRVATIYSIGLHVCRPISKRFLKDTLRSTSMSSTGVPTRSMKTCWATWWTWAWLPTRPSDAKLEIVPLRKDTLVLICHPQTSWPSSNRQTQARWPARSSSASSRTSPPARRIDKSSRNTA